MRLEVLADRIFVSEKLTRECLIINDRYISRREGQVLFARSVNSARSGVLLS